MPIVGARGLLKFAGVPQGATINGVYCHITIVSPSRERVASSVLEHALRPAGIVRQLALLCPKPAREHLFLSELPKRVTWCSPGIPEAWKNAAGNAISYDNVANIVHGDTTHPAMVRIRGKRTCLSGVKIRAIFTPQLVPANSCVAAAGIHGMGQNERFVIGKAAIGHAKHQAVA